MKTKENQKRGISLIVLIITIIVIIILAAAVILSLNNNNPITNAKKATVQSDLKTYTDELSLYIANQYTNSTGTFNPNGINAKEEAMNEYISAMQEKYHNLVEIQNGKLVVRIDAAVGDEKLWASEILGRGTIPMNIPVDSNKTAFGELTGTATNPIIPKGFAPINTDTSIWGTTDGVSKGLVIEDMTGDQETDGNQFVWIPVENISEFKRTDEYKPSGGRTFGECAEDTRTAEYIAMEESVVINQGFYTARYEAGKSTAIPATDGTVKPLSKEKIPVWNSIRWGSSNSVTDPEEGAVTVARAMYPDGNEKTGAVSTLIYGVQWDATLRYLVHNGASVELMKDSRTWGNQGDSLPEANVEGKFGHLQNTGTQTEWSKNNIFDLSGNAYELTMETYSTTAIVCRGGYYSSTSGVSVSARGNSRASNADVHVGFRPTLYIKHN